MQNIDGFSCTKFSVMQDVPLQLWDALNTFYLGGAPEFINRMWHNKVVAYGVNYSQCYFYYLTPKFWLIQFGVLPMVVFFAMVIASIIYFKKLGRFTLPIILIYPLVMIFELYK